jgi:signal transduction histidine kinase
MEAQARMTQELLMNAPAFVCTLRGPDHVYDLVNARYQQLFGKRKIKGKPIMEALPELEGQHFEKVLDDVYNSGVPYVGINFPLRLSRDEEMEPEERYFNFSYQPMYDENRVIYSILVFGYEVTEQINAKNRIHELQEAHRKELEEKVAQRTGQLNEANEELLKRNEDLLRANKELESFAYVSSHDLQEPLRKIQTFTSHILSREYNALSPNGKESFQRIGDAANRMQILIQDLLAYSHANSKDRKFERTDLNDILTDVLSDLKDTIAEKEASIESAGLCEARISPFQFRQVMYNLISNALKFSKPGGQAHIGIQCAVKEGSVLEAENKMLPTGRLIPARKYCHISFQDNGIGFETEYSEKIFEIFQRLHAKGTYPGTGIGLAIVKKVIEHHEGVVTATGHPDTGATFDVYIPA